MNKNENYERGGEQMGKSKTHDEYAMELSEKNPIIKVIGQYNGANTAIEHYCEKHDIYWNITPHNALSGKGCKECGKEKCSAKRKKTHDEYVEELKVKNPTVEVAEEYVDADTLIMHHCLVHDVFWRTTPVRALQGVGCKECKVEKFRQIRCKTHEQYIEEVTIINPDIIVVGKYTDARTPIEHYCMKHGILWNTYPDGILKGIGCKECGNEKARDKNIKTHNQYLKDLYAVNPDLNVVEEYRGANVAILHHCKIDGYVWLAKPANILSGTGCPQCNESYGERQVRQWLEKHHITYQYQKTFDDCRDVRVLPFDFYIPEYNVCIEYDGEQHFRPVKFDGKNDELAIKQFEKIMLHDDIKNKYCENNMIHLLRIPYFKNVEEELNRFYSFNIVTSMVI